MIELGIWFRFVPQNVYLLSVTTRITSEIDFRSEKLHWNWNKKSRHQYYRIFNSFDINLPKFFSRKKIFGKDMAPAKSFLRYNTAFCENRGVAETSSVDHVTGAARAIRSTEGRTHAQRNRMNRGSPFNLKF